VQLLVYGMSLLNMFAPSRHIWKPVSLPTTRGRRILLGVKQTFCFSIKDAVSDSDYSTTNYKAPDKLSVGKDLKWSGNGLIDLLLRHLSGRSKRNHEK